MTGEVVVGPADYQAWLQRRRQGGSMADAGQKLFVDLACNTCHRPDAQGADRCWTGCSARPSPAGRRTVVADRPTCGNRFSTRRRRSRTAISPSCRHSRAGQRGTAAPADRTSNRCKRRRPGGEHVEYGEAPPHHYLNDGYGIKSWLLTRDHKRIVLSRGGHVFFFIGGAFAV